MGFKEEMLKQKTPPKQVRKIPFPNKETYYPSPVDWRNEILYFLMVDRFSDGKEDTRPLLDKGLISRARQTLKGKSFWSWADWHQSGKYHFQGGNLKGVLSKLDYLKSLGISSIWLSPIYKQRGHLDTFHGYGIQNFLDVDPRFGTREELCQLVEEAHKRGIRVILDIIFNHSGYNWNYKGNTKHHREVKPYIPGSYEFGSWLGEAGNDLKKISGQEEGVWPKEFQDPDCYTKAGFGDLGAGDIDDPFAEHKRSDFNNLRDFKLDHPGLLKDLADCYKYWIALTDCDGFRIDTMKHVTFDQGRNFCGMIKEFAQKIGKHNFFLVGEVAGGQSFQVDYMNALGRNMDAVLDIGEARTDLHKTAKGLGIPGSYFGSFSLNDSMGSHRNLGNKHVSILDDHDHVMGEKIRFSSEASSELQIVAATAIQLFTLGIPCIYYGTEQSLMSAPPEQEERAWLPEWREHECYLREAMFGPDNPLKHGLEGLAGKKETNLPGFGPFGTRGHHCFDEKHPAYVHISNLAKVRQENSPLRYGRQYIRQVAFLSDPFGYYYPGEILAWSRILDDIEILCIVNTNGIEKRGGYVQVESALNSKGTPFRVLYSTEQGNPRAKELLTKCDSQGHHFVTISNLAASGVVVLTNAPD